MKKFESPSSAPREATESTGQRPGFAERLTAQVERHEAARDAERQQIVAAVIEKARPFYEACLPIAAGLATARVAHLPFLRTLETIPWGRLQRTASFSVQMLAKSAKCRLDQCLNAMEYADSWGHIQRTFAKIERGDLGGRVLGPYGTGYANTEELRASVSAFCDLLPSFSTALASLKVLVGELDGMLSGIQPVVAGTVLAPLPALPPTPGEASAQQSQAEM